MKSSGLPSKHIVSKTYAGQTKVVKLKSTPEAVPAAFWPVMVPARCIFSIGLPPEHSWQAM
jgi:hypothetical protein